MKQASPVPVSKRVMDITLSLLLLAATAPLMLAAVLLVKFSSKGPVFYVARRAGLRGKEFGQLKFRTMRHGADKEGAFTAENDPRVFPAGRILRLFKIDELPQFLNVLRGDMSFVGPRPEDIQTVRTCYTLEQREALEVLPGLTGIPQVRFFPDLSTIDPEGMDPQRYYRERILPARLALDVEYARNRTFWLDASLIVKTAGLILFESWRILLFGARSRQLSEVTGAPKRRGAHA